MLSWAIPLAVASVAFNIYYVQKYTSHYEASAAILVSGLFWLYAVWALESKGSQCWRLGHVMVVSAILVNLIASNGFC